MRQWLAIVLMVVLSAPVFGQDEVKPDQLKKMYEETLSQLRDAQNRKNELAKESARQADEINELKKKVEALSAENGTLRREAMDFSAKTFFYRSHYAAWQSFIEKYPALAGRWKVFLECDLVNSTGKVLGIE